MKKFGRITSIATALTICAVSINVLSVKNYANADYNISVTGSGVVEYLDRGISAINTGSGMMISWRFLANDPDDAVFKLYRDNNLIYTSEAGKATSYLDKQGSSSSKYKIETLSQGEVIASDECSLVSNQSYFDIPMDVPPSGSDYSYMPGDCSVGDVDGDGQYEIFVKWDPTNYKDNSQWGYTGNVYIDCYTLEGRKLWRIDLGKNIRAGAHYTQFLVADFDLDGKAEMTCKTADGTVDGTGKVIGDGSKDYRNAGGYILDGPEYYTLFDGMTGAALDTVDYEYPRGVVSKQTWGDDYGNRCDRFLGAVCYLDGIHPSAVSVRGYYTRMTAVAYDVVDKKLVKRWGYDSGWSWSANSGYGNGNHNCMPADVDNDGKDELFLGAVCLDDNGKVLWSNNLGHGDAMHIGDFLPERPGLEAWVCHEHAPYGVSLLDAKTGKQIFHYDHSKDTGRCAAGNIYAGNPGAEFWGGQSGSVYDSKGTATDIQRPSMNFLIYWDGDLERELLDNITISKINAQKKIDYIFNADGCASNNSTKATPCLSADIFGDWREELILRTSDNKHLRVYCTPHTTDVRLTTLMHDVQYRNQVATEQNCYNQPPHTSFFLGTGYDLPERPNVKLNNTPPEPPAPKEGKYIKNFVVKDIANSNDWDISLSTSTGGTIFGDRNYTYISLPDVINGAEAIMTACDSKNTDAVLAEFTAGDDIDVYILLDTRVEENDSVPAWLNDWTKTGLTAESSNDVTFSLYKMTYNSGDTITLGTNGMSGNVINYTVFVKEKEEQIVPPTEAPTTEATVTEDPTTIPTSSEQPFISLLGDANCDGAVTIADATAILQHLGNKDKYPLSKQGEINADVAEPKGITANDAIAIQQLDAGIINNL